jgi:hypothetical protein
MYGRFVTPLASETSKVERGDDHNSSPSSTSIHSVNKAKELQLLTSVTTASTAPRSSIAVATNPMALVPSNVDQIVWAGCLKWAMRTSTCP